MAAARKYHKKKTTKRIMKSDKQAVLSVVTVRISDEEKERMEMIMRNLEIKRYSDVMRMALHMVRRQQLPG